MQYRHEYKYQLNLADYYAIKGRLDLVMKKDSHVKDGKYHIRSLYFDTASDTALREKLDGVSRRKKFRIRMYDGDDSFIRLEKKVKVSGLGTKISAKLTREEVEKIQTMDLFWMSNDKRELVRELYIAMIYDGLKPKTIVDYVRVPYIYEPGNVRVTLDKDIRSGIFNTDFFNDEIPTLPATQNNILMEVKYDNFLPDVVRDIVQLDSRMVGAFSKYAACRSYDF